MLLYPVRAWPRKPLFCVRKEGFIEDLSISAVSLTGRSGRVTSSGEVRTTGGIISTRRPVGTPWQVFVGHDPAGDWSVQLADTQTQRQWFRDGLIEDLVIVTTIAAQTPSWP